MFIYFITVNVSPTEPRCNTTYRVEKAKKSDQTADKLTLADTRHTGRPARFIKKKKKNSLTLAGRLSTAKGGLQNALPAYYLHFVVQDLPKRPDRNSQSTQSLPTEHTPHINEKKTDKCAVFISVQVLASFSSLWLQIQQLMVPRLSAASSSSSSSWAAEKTREIFICWSYPRQLIYADNCFRLSLSLPIRLIQR